MNIIHRIICTCLCVFTWFSESATAQVFFQVQDTTAGEPTRVIASGLTGQEAVNLRIIKPDQSLIQIPLRADSEGLIRDSIYGLHTQVAGEYRSQLVRFDELTLAENSLFMVSPGIPSAYKSKIVLADNLVPANGRTASSIQVIVQDAYGNPIANQPVRLISSRNSDLIQLSEKTNQFGVVTGQVSSNNPGVSVLTAVIGDTVIFEQAELVFHLDGNGFGNVGQSENESGVGQFLKAQLFDSDIQEVKYFTLEGLSSELNAGQNYSVEIIARDETGEVVPDYLGQVRFSSSDSLAQIPSDYNFTGADQGRHDFSLAVTFATPGEQTLKVVDASDGQVEGEISVSVVDPSNIDPISSRSISIQTPVPGTYNSAKVVISGTAPPSSTIELLDGATVLTRDFVVGNDGRFVYETPNLADGIHKFKAFSSDKSIESNEVTIQIDKTPPGSMSFSINPDGDIPAGSTFDITVGSDEALFGVSCDFNNLTKALKPDGDKFTTTFQAPGTAGEYPIGCTLSDLVNNELVEPQAGVARVVAAIQEEPIDEDEEEDNDQPVGTPIIALPENVAPTAVSSLSAQPAEDRITLFWSPATDDKAIKQYRIDFGMAADALFQSNTTPDNRTSWYIDNLTPGTKYYFKVYSIDEEGAVGPESRLVESTTLGGNFKSAAVPTAGISDWLPYLAALIVGVIFIFISIIKPHHSRF